MAEPLTAPTPLTTPPPIAPPPVATPPQAAPTGSMVQLVGRDGGLHDVPVAKAHEAVASGKFGWVAGTTLTGIDPATGIAKDIPAEAASAFLKGGGRLATSDEAKAAALEKQYGGIGGGLAAAGEGAARGLTAGLSDPLAVGIGGAFGKGEEVRKHLAGVQEANPGLAIGGEVVGAVAPMFFGDEAGLADILGSIPRGIEGGGKLAADFAGKLVGTSAEGLLARSGQKAIKGAAKAIVEGGLWGAGSEISDATLQNKELTAENVIAAAGHGALLAGALGGTLGAAEPLAGKAFSTIQEHLPGGGKLADAADEQYIRAISANKKSFIEQMKDRFGGENATNRIANRLRSEGIVEAGDDIEKIAQKASKAEAAAVEGLTATVEKVGADGVRIEDALAALDKRAKQFEGKLGFKAAAGEIRTKMAEIADIYGPRAVADAEGKGIPAAEHLLNYQIPIKDLLEQRRGLEGTINWQTDTVLAQGRKAAGRTLEDVIMNAGEKAAKEGGDEAWKADYLAAKARYSETRFINDVTTDAVNAKLRNRLVSPSDYGAGLAGMIAGEAGGHALTGGIGGMLIGAAHHQIRQRGNATLAVLLDKLGTFGGLSEMHAASMGRLDSSINTALARGASEKMSPVKKMNFDASRFEQEAKRVSDLAGAPDAVKQHMHSQTMAIGNHAPEVAAAVNQKAVAAVRYLSTKLPPAYTNSEGTRPTLTPRIKPVVSKPAMTGFLRAVDAVERKPEETIKNILKGHGTLEDADALKNVYPAYYAEAQERVQRICETRETPVPFQTAVRLGILFDIPTTPGMQPDLIQQEQQMYAAIAKPQGPPPPGGGKKGSRSKPLKLATMMGSMFESGNSEGDAKS